MKHEAMRWLMDDEDDSVMFSPADVAGGLDSINILEETNSFRLINLTTSCQDCHMCKI